MDKTYIEREKIFPNGVFFASAEDPLASLDELIKRIWSIPTADVVEVVRCKDCKHWKHFDHLGCTIHVKVCGLANYMIGENGYCLYGERRDNNAAD